MSRVQPNGREAKFAEEEIIVSKTDLKGLITYANDVFIRVSGFTEDELMGKPHNIIRHPEMPGCVFELLWDTLKRQKEIFAYVLNMGKDGSHYWVFAHVTPSYDMAGAHIGYHSNRRVPYPDALPAVKELYKQLRAEERRHVNKRDGIAASSAILGQVLTQSGKTYSEFVFGLSKFTNLGAAAA
jgi:PAS domain S-box-containing protein